MSRRPPHVCFQVIEDDSAASAQQGEDQRGRRESETLFLCASTQLSQRQVRYEPALLETWAFDSLLLAELTG